MAPVKNQKGKANAMERSVTRARARDARESAAAEVVPPPARQLRPRATASPARVNRKQARAAAPRRKANRLVSTPATGEPESSADAARANPESSPAVTGPLARAVERRLQGAAIPHWPEFGTLRPSSQRVQKFLEEFDEQLTVALLQVGKTARDLHNQGEGLTVEEANRAQRTLWEKWCELRDLHSACRNQLQEYLALKSGAGKTPTDATTSTPKRSKNKTPSAGTSRKQKRAKKASSLKIRIPVRNLEAGSAGMEHTSEGEEAATAANPQATPARRNHTPMVTSTSPEGMEGTETDPAQEADTMSPRENDAVEALVRLSHDRLLVFDGNQEDTINTSTAFQPQLEFESDEELFAPRRDDEQLQAYLYRQQRLAGIPPEQMISMSGEMGAPTRGRGQGPVNRPENPSVVQFSAEGGLQAPSIAPARFEGMQPLPNTIDELPANDQSATEALDLFEEVYGSNGRPEDEPLRGIPSNSQPSDPITPGAMRWQSSNTNEVGELEGSTDPMTQTKPIQTQRQNRMRPRRILPKQARNSTNRPSSSTITPVHHAHSEFDILKALTGHPELAIMLTGFLEPRDLPKLFACSKIWNAFSKSHLKEIIINQSKQQAPKSARAFPYHCYPQLCKPIPDPVFKNLLVPDFPWLLMIIDRERIVQSIMQWMRRTSCVVPARSGDAIKKLWFLMDIPDTRRRTWTVENEKLWSDMDLFLAGLFMMQIDSALQDDDESDFGAVRRLLMAQKSLSVLWGVLSGEIWQSELEIVQSYLRWRYEPRPYERDMNTILGVPIDEIGLLQYEAYGQHGRKDKVRRPDSLVISELKNRELDIPKLYREALALKEVMPDGDDDGPRWDEALKEAVEGSGLDWRNAVNLDRLKIS